MDRDFEKLVEAMPLPTEVDQKRDALIGRLARALEDMSETGASEGERFHAWPRRGRAVKTQATVQAELEEELRQAEEDVARGDFIELTVEQLDRCIAAGERPWPDESSE